MKTISPAAQDQLRQLAANLHAAREAAAAASQAINAYDDVDKHALDIAKQIKVLQEQLAAYKSAHPQRMELIDASLQAQARRDAADEAYRTAAATILRANPDATWQDVPGAKSISATPVITVIDHETAVIRLMAIAGAVKVDESRVARLYKDGYLAPAHWYSVQMGYSVAIKSDLSDIEPPAPKGESASMSSQEIADVIELPLEDMIPF